ncbi:MAG: uroporphyrinogen-III synthase, partial [Chlamydiae bacterium]|nr:uroporphyrinogen-III synthase [Chlamydiota bacterium]
PVIRLFPRTMDDERVVFCLTELRNQAFSHCIVTSKHAVEMLRSLSRTMGFNPYAQFQGKWIAIGPVTEKALEKQGLSLKGRSLLIPEESTQEGVISYLQQEVIPTQKAHFFYPHSSLARPLLKEFLQEQQEQQVLSFEGLDLYDTLYQTPLPIPSLEEVDEIVFTSPSTVVGFFQAFPLPSMLEGKKIVFQGPITEKAFFHAYHRKMQS